MSMHRLVDLTFSAAGDALLQNELDDRDRILSRRWRCVLTRTDRVGA